MEEAINRVVFIALGLLLAIIVGGLALSYMTASPTLSIVADGEIDRGVGVITIQFTARGGDFEITDIQVSVIGPNGTVTPVTVNNPTPALPFNVLDQETVTFSADFTFSQPVSKAKAQIIVKYKEVGATTEQSQRVAINLR